LTRTVSEPHDLETSTLPADPTDSLRKSQNLCEARKQSGSRTHLVSVTCDWHFSCREKRSIDINFVLRIQKSIERNKVVFSLSGRIEAEDVAELERLCRSEADDHSLVLDLEDVRLVNREAIKFLADCEAHGTKLRNCPAYVREWIDKAGEGDNPRQD
jgi:hypothetical protein